MGFDSFLAHIGVGHLDGGNSGRWPYGSGENPYQHMGMHPFRAQVQMKRDQGKSMTEIAQELGMNTSQLRAKITMAKEEEEERNRTYILKKKDKGYSNTAIARELGMSEGYVRKMLKPIEENRKSKVKTVAEELAKQVDDKVYLDIGSGVERQLGISKERLKTAVAYLEEQGGYKTHKFPVEQLTNPGKFTWYKVLTKDNVTYGELRQNQEKIRAPQGVYFEDDGLTARGIKPPVSIDSKRVQIKYTEDGGSEKDGVIEIRPGVEDLTLGKNHYAQVRIAVDGTHYLKGMAMYNPDLPKGCDILFNTNKHKGTPKMDVLKTMSDDKDNPFGATVRQFDYDGKDGKKHQSPINIVNDDSDWGHWSRNLASQFLSKQYPQTAKRQLDLDVKAKEEEFARICALENPMVKKNLLKSFAEDCDSAAVDLKAAPLPRQQTHVILPLTEIKDTEVYAPNYKTGEEVILVRYPHAGIFEIPRLKVNNNNKQGRALLGATENAIGINSKVAEQLSGADFDGDTVVVIPTKNQNLKTSKPLKDLVDFDPKEAYRGYEGMTEVGPKGDGFNKGREMGMVSNLITDMTIRGAKEPEMVRAVRHSMVVIDAEKHQLDWKRSEKDNRINELKEKYQKKENGRYGGASTLISSAKSPVNNIPQRKQFTYDKRHIDPETGEKKYEYSGNTYDKWRRGENGEWDKVAEKLPYMEKTTKMAETKDARTLSSGTRIEEIYAGYANKMKSLANETRKEYLATDNIRRDPEAAKKYAKEVASLEEKLNKSLQNAPRERQAQLMADYVAKAKRRDNPNMEKDEYKKIKAQALDAARRKSGAAIKTVNEQGEKISARTVDITPKEWEAIQANAISANKLEQILSNANMKKVREYATPRDKRTIPNATKSRIKAMLNSGYTQQEIAEACDVSLSAVKDVMRPKDEKEK